MARSKIKSSRTVRKNFLWEIIQESFYLCEERQLRAFSTMWGLHNPEIDEKYAMQACDVVYKTCECKAEIVYFAKQWYNYDIDFDSNINVPTELHNCEYENQPAFLDWSGDYPKIVDWWDTAINPTMFQSMQRYVFFTFGKGRKNVSPWPEIDLTGNCSMKMEMSSGSAMDLFAKYYQWHESGQGTLELDICDKHECVEKGFHGDMLEGPKISKCPFSRHACMDSFKRCDCYTVKVEGECIESLIGEISQVEKPMENFKFQTFVTGMLKFLERMI